MIIAFEDSLMYLCSPGAAGEGGVPEGFVVMDDSRLDPCFDALKAGKNVFVHIHHGIRPLHHYLMTHYRYLKAAGGVVSSPDGNPNWLHKVADPSPQFLMISRSGRWDLPKGMVESGESLKEAARREVMEETGVTPDAVNQLITKTYHIYDKYGGWHLKQTSWYAMTASRQETRPQTEEEIAQAVWVPAETCRARLGGSYASLRLLAKEIDYKTNS